MDPRVASASKKQNKLNFYFSLSGVPNVRGGWVGSDVWDKIPNKHVFFDTFPYNSKPKTLFEKNKDCPSLPPTCLGCSRVSANLKVLSIDLPLSSD